MKKPNKEKRSLKNEPKFDVALNEEQKDVIRLFYEYDVCFVIGEYASGKTLSATYAALRAFRRKEFNKIWITRPMLKNELAALPGDINDKMAPYVFPITQNLEACQGKQFTTSMIEKGDIEIMPVSVAKGATFVDSVVIVDEIQDMDYDDFRTILTRLGKGSKMLLCGSLQQIDKRMKKTSCIYDVMRLQDSGLVGFKILTSNHRNEALTKIIEYLENEQQDSKH